MKTLQKNRQWLAVLSMIALIAGCSTPDSRIREHQALFDSLPAKEQGLIREGRVGIGFTPEMVMLAVGEPDRKWTRTDAAGVSEIWSYTTYEGPDGRVLYRGWYHQGYGALYPFYDAYPARKDREYFKVTFNEGRVTSVEQDSR